MIVMIKNKFYRAQLSTLSQLTSCMTLGKLLL